MLKIANASERERRIVFLNTAEKLEIHPAIVEKDFWVCFIFIISRKKKNLTD